LQVIDCDPYILDTNTFTHGNDNAWRFGLVVTGWLRST